MSTTRKRLKESLRRTQPAPTRAQVIAELRRQLLEQMEFAARSFAAGDSDLEDLERSLGFALHSVTALRENLAEQDAVTRAQTPVSEADSETLLLVLQRRAAEGEARAIAILASLSPTKEPANHVRR